MSILEQILTFAATCVSMLIALLTFLIKSIKNGKAKKVLQQTLEITRAVQPLIVKAEQFKNYGGNEKKQFVLTEIQRFALDRNIKIDTEQISDLIDQTVSTTKQVNMRDKDRMAEFIKTNKAADY